MATPQELLAMAKSAGVQFPDLPPQLQEAVASGRMDEATARQRALANRPQYRAALGLPPNDGSGAPPGALQPGGEDEMRAARQRLGGNGSPGGPRAVNMGRPPGSSGPGGAAGEGTPGFYPAPSGPGGAAGEGTPGFYPSGGPFVRMAMPSGARTSDGSSDMPAAGASSPWGPPSGAPTPYSPGGLPAGGMKPQGQGMPRMAGKSPGMMPPSSLDGGMAKPKPQISDLAELAGGPPRASMNGGGLQAAGGAPPPTTTDPKPQLSDLASATAGYENRRRMMDQRRTAGVALGQKAY